ncbi:hypothetical protein EOL07_25580, partial [Citrobacter freundii]
MSLIKNSFYNLAGFAIPTLIAVPALGYLARVIGVEVVLNRVLRRMSYQNDFFDTCSYNFVDNVLNHRLVY